jgi:hypothetical protein
VRAFGVVVGKVARAVGLAVAHQHAAAPGVVPPGLFLAVVAGDQLPLRVVAVARQFWRAPSLVDGSILRRRLASSNGLRSTDVDRSNRLFY